jgi:hypothetical protein
MIVCSAANALAIFPPPQKALAVLSLGLQMTVIWDYHVSFLVIGTGPLSPYTQGIGECSLSQR